MISKSPAPFGIYTVIKSPTPWIHACKRVPAIWEDGRVCTLALVGSLHVCTPMYSFMQHTTVHTDTKLSVDLCIMGEELRPYTPEGATQACWAGSSHTSANRFSVVP